MAIPPGHRTDASVTEIASGLLEQNESSISWITNASEDALESSLSYKNLKGDPFK
jgi:hypothetical protein